MAKQNHRSFLNLVLLGDHLDENFKIFAVVIKLSHVTTLAIRATVTAKIPSIEIPRLIGKSFNQTTVRLGMFSVSVSDNDCAFSLRFFPNLKEQIDVVVTFEKAF
ncbi:hypothetical protein D3C87_1818180 [compost metagenome]